MTKILELLSSDWGQHYDTPEQENALNLLEDGGVIFLPNLAFPLLNTEHQFLAPTSVGTSKNISYNINTDTLRGSSFEETQAAPLKAMIKRFAINSRQLVSSLISHYEPALMQSRTSFRPVEVAGRSSSWRKDDTRLHVDAFPSSPVHGQRILRVFSNINPHHSPRTWRLGEPFEDVASRYMPNIRPPIPGSSQLLKLLKITKSLRTPYDHYMLHLHDSMKADLKYQKEVDQLTFNFPPGSTWVVYSDQASHAAMSGQYMLEQTFYLPVQAMFDESKAPLRVLERMTNRPLV